MTTPSTSAQGPDLRREEQLRIQAVGAAISRREWWEVEQAYNAIRDEFDRRPASPSPAASPASPSGDAIEALQRRIVEAVAASIKRSAAVLRPEELAITVEAGIEFLFRKHRASLASDATPAPTSGGEDGGEA